MCAMHPSGDPFMIKGMAAVELPKSYTTKLIKERVIWFKSSHGDFRPWDFFAVGLLVGLLLFSFGFSFWEFSGKVKNNFQAHVFGKVPDPFDLSDDR